MSKLIITIVADYETEEEREELYESIDGLLVPTPFYIVCDEDEEGDN